MGGGVVQLISVAHPAKGALPLVPPVPTAWHVEQLLVPILAAVYFINAELIVPCKIGWLASVLMAKSPAVM